MTQVNLPATVKHLKLSTHLTTPKVDIAAQVHDAATFIQTIAQKHPAMQRIEVAYGVHWTEMYSAVWGRIREDMSGIDSEQGTGGLLGPKADLQSRNSFKCSSEHCTILSVVVSSTYPLPLGKLTFMEHRRKILQHDPSADTRTEEEGAVSNVLDRNRFWILAWMVLRRWLKNRWFWLR